MKKTYRVLVCEFHQESNTFNPEVYPLEQFAATRYLEGAAFQRVCMDVPCAAHGIFDAIMDAGGEPVPTIGLFGGSGGRVADDVYRLLTEKMEQYIVSEAPFDGIFASLHGATCTQSEDDACGRFIEHLRKLVGEDTVIAASFDLHANITERLLQNTDVICGYQSYPHVDYYETGYRAAKLGMRKLAGKPTHLVAAAMPLLVPPAGYTSLESPFKEIIDRAKQLVADGTLLDCTVFQVQPWLDIPEIVGRVVAIAEDAEAAKRYVTELADAVYARRDEYWPDMKTIDEVIDRAESDASAKPVILVDSADSPNGGASGDSVAVALRIHERGSRVRAGMFVKSPDAVETAFACGVGGTAEFSIGAQYTPGLPGPLVATGRVRSLHDGVFMQEGPACRGLLHSIGKAAVVCIDNMDILLCQAPAASGDPQLLRHFGIEPMLYDLIVVKANTSFLVPYGRFSSEFYYTDTPGAGATNLKWFPWENVPRDIYPFIPGDDSFAATAVSYRG